MFEIIALFIGQVVLGWIIADLLSGLVHYWLDEVASENIPIIGKYVVMPNRAHHLDPLKFTRATVVKRNLASWLFVAVVSSIWLLVFGYSLIWLSATVGALLINEIHYYAHLPKKAPKLVSMLQEMGMIQSPKQHAGHHRHPNNKNYCTLSDWCNPVINVIRVIIKR